MPATTGMKGAGFYDKHSTAQQASIRLVFDWIESAVAGISLPSPSRVFTVLDLGSSEGRNALVAMNAVVEAVRSRQAGQLIQTIYSDLPSNNFNRLFLNLDEAWTENRSPSDVYASAVAGSFYETLVPPASVHFATAFNALLWLHHLPTMPVRDFVVYRRPHPPKAGFQVSPECAAAFSRRADEDLVRFLECRAKELAPGGKLLVASPGDSTDHRLCDGLYDALNDACLDLIEAGRLSRARYEQLTIPVYFRTVAETIAPLERDDSDLKSTLTLDRAETLEVPTPFLVEFDRTGDAAALAEAYTGFLRAFTEPVARAALVGQDNDSAILDQLYGRVQARVETEPARYRFRYLLTCALFTRR